MDRLEQERIANLPETMSEDALYREFKLLVEEPASSAESNAIDRLEAVFKLSERQWRCYALLEPDLHKKVDRMVLDLWDAKSIENTECVIAICARLGLAQTFEHLKEALQRGLPEAVRNEIEEADLEFGATIANPFAGMPYH